MKKNKHKFLSILVCAFIFIAPHFVFAQEKYAPQYVRLGTDILEKGYTFKNRDNTFYLGIFPNIFENETLAKITRVDESQFSYPSNKKRVSDVFQYMITTDGPDFLQDPVAVSIAFDSTSDTFKRIHFDDGKGNWRPVPTTFDYSKNHARAYVPFKYVSLAVFEEPNYGPKKVGSESLNIDAYSGAIIDAETNKVLYERRGNDQVQIASITKLFTAFTALELESDFSRTVTISPADYAYGALLGIRAGQKINYKDLIYATLVHSGNDGAKAVAHGAGLDLASFTNEMNAQVKKAGLSSTHFDGVTGLEAGNKSTAVEVAKFSNLALRNFELLKATTTKASCLNDIYGTRIGCYDNTNKLLWSEFYITGGKTGYLPPSYGGIGASLVTKARLSNGKEVIAVALGNPGLSGRFGDVRAMLQWTERNYSWTE